jgi:hypothetical protein
MTIRKALSSSLTETTYSGIVDIITGVITTVKVHHWTVPNDSAIRLDVSAEFRCPMCNYPMNVNLIADDMEPNSFSPKQLFQCPAHWTRISDDGFALSGREKCSWSGVFYKGQIHSPRCKKLKQDVACTCKKEMTTHGDDSMAV